MAGRLPRQRMTLRKGLRTTIASLCVVVASTATSCASPDKQRFHYVRITVDGQETLGISKKDGAIRGVVVFFHGPDSNEFAMTADEPHKVMTESLVDADFAVVSTNSGGHAFGDAASQKNYRELGNMGRGALPRRQHLLGGSRWVPSRRST